MGCLIRFAFAAVIVLSLAVGACDMRAEKARQENQMDGSTAGANAVTLEDLEVGHVEQGD